MHISYNSTFKIMCMHVVCLCVGVHVTAGACGGQKGALEALKLELQAAS